MLAAVVDAALAAGWEGWGGVLLRVWIRWEDCEEGEWRSGGAGVGGRSRNGSRDGLSPTPPRPSPHGGGLAWAAARRSTRTRSSGSLWRAPRGRLRRGEKQEGVRGGGGVASGARGSQGFAGCVRQAWGGPGRRCAAVRAVGGAGWVSGLRTLRARGTDCRTRCVGMLRPEGETELLRRSGSQGQGPCMVHAP